MACISELNSSKHSMPSPSIYFGTCTQINSTINSMWVEWNVSSHSLSLFTNVIIIVSCGWLCSHKIERNWCSMHNLFLLANRHRWYRWWGFREPPNGSAVEPLLLPNCSLSVCDESNSNQYHFVALLLYIPSSVCRCNTICVLGGGGFNFVCGSMDGWMIRWMVDPAARDWLRRQDPLWMMRQQNPQISNTKRSMDEGNPELIIIQSMCHTFVVGTATVAAAQPLLSSTLSL